LKKYIIFIVLIVFFIFLQSTNIYTHLNLNGVQPDFLLIIISISSFLLGPMAGQIIGFITGFIVDLIAGGLLGISTFTYTVFGYTIGLVGKKVYGNNFIMSILMLFTVTIAKALILSVIAAIFLKPGYFGYFYQGKVFLEAVINGLIAPVFFIIITRIDREVLE